MVFTIDGEPVTGLTADGDPVQEVTVDGDVAWQRETTDPGTPGADPQTSPNLSPAERASRAGLTINNTEYVTSMSEIAGDSNTMYIVDGSNQPLTHNGKHGLGTVNDVAICGINGATLDVPADWRDYSLTTSGGARFLWSGISFDQTAPGAWGRLNINVQGGGIVEHVTNIGPGRRSNPDPSTGGYSGPSGPTIHLPAGNGSGVNYIRDVELVHGGVFGDTHDGNRPIGLFLAESHNGTLQINRSAFEEFPNNALYATNTTGSVIATNTRFWNNGVTNGRIAFGRFENCVHGFDYQNTGLQNANTPNHGVAGISVDDKGHGTSVDAINCTIIMQNVAQCGGGIVARDFGEGGHIDEIKNCDIHMHNVGNRSDVRAEPNGGSIDSIIQCDFKGTASDGVCVKNQGPTIQVSQNTFDYPSGRANYSGPVTTV